MAKNKNSSQSDQPVANASQQNKPVDPEEEIIVIDKWDSGQVKMVLDETAKRHILTKFNYEESNFLVDIRLFLCLLPVGSAFFALFYDFMHPFPESEQVLRGCVYAYIVLMIILTVYSTYVESNTILIAYKGKKKIKVSSIMKRFNDKYTLVVGDKKWTKSVANYFDVNGEFLMQKFENDVAKLHNPSSKKHSE